MVIANKINNYLVGKLFKKMDNEVQAIEYLEEAVKEGHEKAKILLIDIYEQNGLKHCMGDDELTLYWYEKAANLGSRYPHIWLGEIYYKKKDYEKAFNSFKISNEDEKKNSGGSRDSYHLGKMYYFGRGVEKDYKKAFEYFHEELADNSGNSYDRGVYYGLGLLYKDGKGVEKDVPKAIEYWHKAEKRGHSTSAGILGWMYYYGAMGAEQDYAKAIYFIAKAVDKDNKLGHRMLKTIIRKLNG